MQHMLVCKICGKEIDSNRYYKDVGETLKEQQMCFYCNFWRERLEEDAKRPPHTWCVIDGTHYVIEPDEPGNYFQGFGGAEFNIEFNDGTRITTHNLWCQGEPEEDYWKEKFPDNAKFVDNKKWQKIGECSYLL